eukprot:TRINITY_DN2397_c0_g3_i2.p1 TRINITY_DN2397_c0_g3~~TRINITY_DN2397_c0_g3_i2.p1  ORF type:complete len:148 (+),score=9.43 TRINITY_DN2397_c0_g3_i2:170-613(+)
MNTRIQKATDHEIVNQIINIGKPYRKNKILGFVPPAALHKAIDDETIYTIHVDKKLVGYMYLIFRKRPQKMIELKHIAIHQDRLRFGYGTKLIELLKVIKHRHKLPLILKVEHSNTAAIKFYIKHGFNITKEETKKSGIKVLAMEQQ